MKKNFIYLIFAGLMFQACGEESLPDVGNFESRAVQDLEVTYSVQGSEISRAYFTSKAETRTIEVNLNNEMLRWAVESDRNWCTVVAEDHQGSGSFTIEVSANEDFDDRDMATLTFVAGEFRGFTLGVYQNGCAFILSQPYFLQGKDAGTISVNVTTPEGTEWDFDSPSWARVTAGAVTEGDGFNTTPLTITLDENADAGRFGQIVLAASNGETDQISLYQFGTDIAYDEAGNIYLDRDEAQTLSFIAPEYTIGSFTLPEYVKQETVSNYDGTVEVTLTFDENLSDCSETRESSISLTLNNSSLSTITLPTVSQDYIPAYGLVTLKGLKRFEAAVEAGESIAEWESDGKVTLKGNIDLEEAEGWDGIGTAAHPFTGEFDGNGYGISGLHGASAGFFHYIKDAKVSNLSILEGNGFYWSGTYEEDFSFGGIADIAENSTISSCVFNGNLDFSGIADDNHEARVGGIAGYADASTRISSCKVGGSIVISSGKDEDGALLVGGIAARAGEALRNEFNGTITFSSSVATPCIGGILARLEEGNNVNANSFTGSIKLSGAASNFVIGGLYGVSSGARTLDNGADKSVTMGSIEIGTYAVAATSRAFVGGMIGFAESGSALTLKGYETATNFLIDNSVAKSSAFFIVGGALGATDPNGSGCSVTLDGMLNRGGLSVKYGGSSIGIKGLRTNYGGIAGFVNGALTAKDCNNEGILGTAITSETAASKYSANTASYSTIIAGIVASAEGGNATFSNCENKAMLTNYQYNNRVAPLAVYDNHYCGNVCAGIIGAFDYYKADNGYTLSVSGCKNSAVVSSFRGVVGGIVGYARNATISDCENSARMVTDDNQSNASHKGGIAGSLEGASTVSGCTSKGSISTSNPGGMFGTPGGIVSFAGSDISIINCASFGTISGTAADGALFGGIIGTATEGTTITSCKFGGVVQGVTVSENNVATLASGNGEGVLTEISYWNGN